MVEVHIRFSFEDFNFPQEPLWLNGIKSQTKAGAVIWSGGQNSSYTNWGSGLPDNGLGKKMY
jgi:hypothetical protein